MKRHKLKMRPHIACGMVLLEQCTSACTLHKTTRHTTLWRRPHAGNPPLNMKHVLVLSLDVLQLMALSYPARLLKNKHNEDRHINLLLDRHQAQLPFFPRLSFISTRMARSRRRSWESSSPLAWQVRSAAACQSESQRHSAPSCRSCQHHCSLCRSGGCSPGKVQSSISLWFTNNISMHSKNTIR